MANVATREAYGKALAQLGKENERIFVLDADLSGSTKTSEFKKVVPERFFNMGIAEGNMMGVAAGLATTGKIVFASTFAMFAAGRGFEQIRNSIAYPKLNVKVAATHAGITVGEDGASHQAIEDIALMRAVPNMTVVVPCDERQTQQVITAAANYVGPMYIRLGRLASPDVYGDDYQFELGKGNVIREGKDVTIVAAGYTVHIALEAAEQLAVEGIDAEVVDMATIKPIDGELLVKSASKTRKVVTIEEHTTIGGLGSAVTEVLSDRYPVPVKRLGVEDRFGQSGKPADLLKEYGLTSEHVVQAVKHLVK